jgi:hypothetical protein
MGHSFASDLAEIIGNTYARSVAQTAFIAKWFIGKFQPVE